MRIGEEGIGGEGIGGGKGIAVNIAMAVITIIDIIN